MLSNVVVGVQVRLAVAGAFHTSYMAPAAEKLQDALNNTTIVTPRIPVISNVDAQPHSDPATIKAILAKQVSKKGGCGGGAVLRPPLFLFGTMTPVCIVLLLLLVLPLQLTSPVQWETTVQTLLDKGLGKCYEVGPGKVIAGIVKRMKGPAVTNITA